MCEYTCLHCGVAIGDYAKVTPKGLIHEHCIDGYHRAETGFVHECPQCNKTGEIKDPNGRTANSVRSITYEAPLMVACPLCGGKGWLKTKPEPIIETKIVGGGKKGW